MTKLMRSGAALLAAVVVGAGAGLAPVSPAAAADTSCEVNSVCLWEDLDWKGQKVTLKRCTPNLGDFNDKASSYWNTTQYTVRLFEGNDYTGRFVDIPAGVRYGSLKTNIYTVYHNDWTIFKRKGEFNDVTSSVCY
jgi:hypothetical protein